MVVVVMDMGNMLITLDQELHSAIQSYVENMIEDIPLIIKGFSLARQTEFMGK